MYRKELCLSLLEDPEQDVANNEDRADRTPRLKWHKVFLFLIGVLSVLSS